MRRTSVLLDDSTMERLKARARRRGTTVTHEIRDVLERALDDDAAAAPNDILEMARRFDSHEGLRYGPYLPVDDDLAKLIAAREIYRDATNSEPDWQ